MTRRVLAILVCLTLLFGMVQSTSAAPLGNSLNNRINDELKIWGKLIIGLSLDASEYSLNIGETHNTTVSSSFKGRVSLDVTTFCSFESSDTAVATVDKNGVVTAIGAGTTSITAGILGKTVSAVVRVFSEETWTLEWNDEFDGSQLDMNKWNLENKGDGFGNNEAQYYKPENAIVEDGKLIIQAKKEAYNNRDYTSAKLFSRGKGDWKYGKFEASIKLPEGQGFWPAFWMMPTDGAYGVWAASGEIDIMEAKGRIPGVTSGTLHYGGAWPNNKYTGSSQTFPQGQSIAQFHTYSIEWEPGEIRWYVDGELFQTQNNWNTMGANGEEKYAFPAPFDQNFYLILNLAIGGNFDGGILPDDSMFPAQMEVDYVRVYELTGRPYKTIVEPNLDIVPLPEGAREPDATGNLVKDINFEQGIKDNQEGIDNQFGDVWNFVHNASFGGAATASVEAINEKNYAKIDVTDRGTQPYSVQFEQVTTLGKGRWYKYSFDAKASKDRTLNTKLGGGPTTGWAAYSDSYTVDLTTEFKHFEETFQMTGKSDILTRIEFNCASDTGTVWIGNIRLEEIQPPAVDYNASKAPLAGGNHIYNGAFDKYTIDRMTYWNVTRTDATAAVSVPESTRELTVDIVDGGASTDAITVGQKGLQLIKGNDYKLTFKARAAAGRTIKLKITSKDGITNYLPEQEKTLTTEMQLFETAFKMDAATDLESQLLFMLGGNNSDVYIDDVKLIKTSTDYTGVTLFPLKNGDFGLGLFAWEPFTQDASADISVVDGEAKVAISNYGTLGWNVMLNQSNMAFSKGIEYELSFDARASIARDIEVSLENSGYIRRFETGFLQLTTESKHFEYTFSVIANEILALKFQLGKTLQPANGDIFIDNVILQVKDAPVLRPPSFATDTTNNRVGQPIELAYGINENWRNAVQAVKVDGNTLSAEQYTLESGKLTVNTNVFTEAKGYDIVVEATGYSTVTISQDILPDDGNVVKNGDLALGKVNWSDWFGDGAAGAFNVEDGAAKIDITNIGPNNWSVQFFQDGVQIEAGKTYELTLKARSTENRPIQVEFSGYKGNESVKFNLTNDLVTYKYNISVPSTNSSFKLNFLIGNVINGTDTTPTTAHTIYIDDVTIKEVVADKVWIEVGTNLITGGTFTDTAEFNSNWKIHNQGIYETNAGKADFAAVNEVVEATVTVPGWDWWHIQLYQEPVIVPAGIYKISFDMRSEESRPVYVELTGSETNRQTFILDNTMKNYESIITVAADGSYKFMFGLRRAGTDPILETPYKIYIDNVKLIEVTE